MVGKGRLTRQRWLAALPIVGQVDVKESPTSQTMPRMPLQTQRPRTPDLFFNHLPFQLVIDSFGVSLTQWPRLLRISQ